jgi:hypothetical protein
MRFARLLDRRSGSSLGGGAFDTFHNACVTLLFG